MPPAATAAGTAASGRATARADGVGHHTPGDGDAPVGQGPRRSRPAVHNDAAMADPPHRLIGCVPARGVTARSPQLPVSTLPCRPHEKPVFDVETGICTRLPSHCRPAAPVARARAKRAARGMRGGGSTVRTKRSTVRESFAGTVRHCGLRVAGAAPVQIPAGNAVRGCGHRLHGAACSDDTASQSGAAPGEMQPVTLHPPRQGANADRYPEEADRNARPAGVNGN